MVNKLMVNAVEFPSRPQPPFSLEFQAVLHAKSFEIQFTQALRFIITKDDLFAIVICFVTSHFA